MDVRLFSRPATLRAPVAAASHRHGQHRRLFLEITCDGVTGVGEVSPLTSAVVPDPAVDDVVDHVVTTAVPRLLSYVAREGELPEWTRIHLWGGGSPASRWSSALLEMALLDWSLARERVPLRVAWSVPERAPATLATTSLIEPDSDWRPPPAAARVRAKVDPRTDPTMAVEAARTWGRPVLWDFNASAHDGDAVRAWASAVAPTVETVAIEQPFAAGDLASHALLARDLPVALSLDESVTSPARVRLIARHGAASMVCAKPPRLGGLAAARATIAEARSHGLVAYVGGFFESPLARSAHAAVAACTGADPSDVARVDVVEDGGDVARDVGIGVVPDLSAATTLQSWENH